MALTKKLSAFLLASVVMLSLAGCYPRDHHYRDHHPPPPPMDRR